MLLGGLKDHLKEIRRCRRLIVIGCGTSYHAAVAVSAIHQTSGSPGKLTADKNAGRDAVMHWLLNLNTTCSHSHEPAWEVYWSLSSSKVAYWSSHIMGTARHCVTNCLSGLGAYHWLQSPFYLTSDTASVRGTDRAPCDGWTCQWLSGQEHTCVQGWCLLFHKPVR